MEEYYHIHILEESLVRKIRKNLKNNYFTKKRLRYFATKACFSKYNEKKAKRDGSRSVGSINSFYSTWFR